MFVTDMFNWRAGKMDPYAVLTYRSQEQKSSTASGGAN